VSPLNRAGSHRPSPFRGFSCGRVVRTTPPHRTGAATAGRCGPPVTASPTPAPPTRVKPENPLKTWTNSTDSAGIPCDPNIVTPFSCDDVCDDVI